MTREESNQKLFESLQRAMAVCVWAAFVFIGLGASTWIWLYLRFKGKLVDLADWGNFGSYLQGSTASLWALAGVLLVLAAFMAQKLQLLTQQKELDDQEKKFQLQQDSIKRENFENTFFKLLNLQNEIVAAIQSGGSKAKGLFVDWAGAFGSNYESYLRRLLKRSNIEGADFADKNNTVGFFTEYYNERESTLGYYYRNLFHVFKFVNDSEIQDPIFKGRYVSLAKAQLSKHELIFLFYYCMIEPGKKFQPLVEQFGLLEHLDKKLLLHPSSHEDFYAKKAYE